MAPKELSVWDVMNGVSEEDAKHDDNIVFAKARRIITKPYSKTWGVNANGVTHALNPQIETPLGDVRLSDAPLLWEEPWADEVTVVAQPH